MEDFSEELIKEYEPVAYDAAGHILAINLPAFVEAMQNQLPHKNTIHTEALIDFVNTLGTNKSGGKNGITRLQYFINAYFQEEALIEANPSTLRFVNDDHYDLTRGSTGTNDPDFIFQDKYTIDAKINGSVEAYMSLVKNHTNFHNATYVLVYLKKENLWVFAKKSENYLTLHPIDDLAETDPWLLDLNLPKAFNSVWLQVDSDFTDDQVPETVAYTFYTRRPK